VDQSEQRYAWRPQGRFGKRMDTTDNLLHDEGSITDIIRGMGPVGSGVNYLTSPIFRSDGVVCIATGGKGNYKCFTFADSDAEGENDKQ